MPSLNYQKIYNAVKRIPKGKVATYGQIAQLAGLPGHARQVGYALSHLDESDIPWHRVINAKGEISPRWHPDLENEQAQRLREEGINITPAGKISLNTYRWQPR